VADSFSHSPAWREQEPLVLIVPEADNDGPEHWQSLWQRKRADCRGIDLGMWDNPHRNTWVNKLNLAIHRADRPVVLVAHGLGCLAVAWWAEYERPAFGHPVVGALLVAPPDVDRPGRDARLARFGACSRQVLPFASFLVASHDDPLGSYRTARALARDWGCRFADAGAVGHIDAQSEIGDWPFGERLLDQLLLEHRRSIEGRDSSSRTEGHQGPSPFPAVADATV
jgi:uncharacterized protein